MTLVRRSHAPRQSVYAVHPMSGENSMTLRHRRAVLTALAAAAIGALSFAPAQAQGAYPTQPIKFIIPAGAGGLPDTVARIMGRRLQDKVGQSVVIENKP